VRARAIVLAVAVDTVAVVLFVILGRRSHDSGSGVVSVLGTAAPFLVALGVAWIIVLAGRMEPLAAMTGVVLWAITAAGGLLLRRMLWDRSTATAFVVVASVALGILLVGWRAVLTFARGADAVRSPSPPSEAGR
jgi:hypothetical protein